MKNFIVAVCAAAGLAGSASAQIYADFVTSSGTISCELYYTATPQTVANFMTLAEGSRAWLDDQTGVVSTTKPPQPFYNGLIFHRVVDATGFGIIQSGSRKGDGTDGPGYNFPDEIHASIPSSYKFDQPYVLAMANSGVNTNGSQFFITATPTLHLEGLHTVFGKVVAGTDVVDAILAVEVDANDKPITPVTIQSVAIRRVGSAATKFKPLKQGLPTVTSPKFKTATTTGDNYRLLYKQPKRSMTQIWTLTPDAPEWDLVFQRFIDAYYQPPKWADVPLGGRTEPLPAAATWLRPVIVEFPDDALSPSVITRWRVKLSNGAGAFEFSFPSSGIDTYSFTAAGSTTPATGTIINSYYYPDGFGATLTLELSGLEALRFRLAFDTQAGTTLAGRQGGSYWNSNSWTPFSGGTAFSMVPLP